MVMEPVVMEEEWWRKRSLDGIEMENPERTMSESKEDYRRHYVLKILIVYFYCSKLTTEERCADRAPEPGKI